MEPKIVKRLPKGVILKQTPAGPLYYTKKYLYQPSYSFLYDNVVFYRYKLNMLNSL